MWRFSRDRVAVNLQGLECDEAPRGATVTRPGALRTTRRARVALRLLEGAPAALQRGGPVRFHHHTSECAARLRVVGSGDDGLLEADVVLSQEMVLLPGDRFVLRRPAPVDTVGGGMVIDTWSQKSSRGTAHGRLRTSYAGPADALAERVERAGEAGCTPTDAAAELGRSVAELGVDAASLEALGRIVSVGGRLLGSAACAGAESRLRSALDAFHLSEPLRAGMSREALRREAGVATAPEVFREILERMQRRGEIRLLGERVASSVHRVLMSAEDAAGAARIDEAFLTAGLDPPDTEELVRVMGVGAGRRLVDVLVEQGRLVRIRDGRLFHADALEELRRRVRDFGRNSRTMDVATFKDLAGVTRRNAIPLLEQLDSERVTRRSGSIREILGD